MSNDSEEFLGGAGSGNSYEPIHFAVVGDGFKGTIAEVPKRVMRPNLNDPTKTEPQLVVNLDDGSGVLRTLWVRHEGFMVSAISDAVTEAGQTKLEVGGVLALAVIELRDTKKPKPARVFRAQYTAPAAPAATAATASSIFDD